MRERDVADHMQTVKYPASRAFINMLREAGIRALHVDSLARDAWRAPDIHYFNDVEVMIRENDLPLFLQTMRSGGYRFILDDPQKATAVEAQPEVVSRMLTKPESPNISLSLDVKWPSDLWVNFHTTWRHGRIRFVDLQQWFDNEETETVTVMGDARIERAPIWGMLLWEACYVTEWAYDCNTEKTKSHIEKLHLIASQREIDWEKALKMAQEYDDEYLVRIGRVDDLLRDFARRCGIPHDPDKLGAGILHNVRYGLEALAEYHPGTVPDSVLEGIREGTGQRPRKIWGHPDPEWGNRYGLSEDAGMVGIAPFSIHTQLEEYGELSAEDFFSRGIVDVAMTSKHPYGPWENCTEDTLKRIFAPL